MSGLIFRATIKTTPQSIADRWLLELVRANSSINENEFLEAFRALNAIHSTEFIRWPSIKQLSIESTKEGFEIESNYSDMSINYFERFVIVLDELGVEEYRARLFDSSSGGVQIWMRPELDIEFENKIVCVIGIDEEEGIHEALEEMGAQLISDITDSTAIVIYAEDSDKEWLKCAKADITLITEDDFWDYCPE